MKAIKILPVILVLLLFIPLVIAEVQVSDLEVVQNNQPIEYIAKGHSFYADLRFKVTGECTSIRADLERIVLLIEGREATHKNVRVDDCVVLENQTNVSECTIHNKEFFLNQDTVPVTITVLDLEGISSKHELTYTFQLDTSNPEATAISVNECTDQCYVHTGSNEFSVTIANSQSGLNDKNVYVALGSIKAPVSKCEDFVCTGSISINCQTRRTLTLGLAESYNDAGRRIQTLSRHVTCDNDPPELIDWNLTTTEGNIYFKSKDTLLVTAAAKERTGAAHIKLDLTELGGIISEGQCQPKEDVYLCSVTGQIGEGEYKDKNVKLIILDSAGNELEDTRAIDVLGAVAQEVDYWDVKVVKKSPSSAINKELAQYVPMTVYYHLRLRQTSNNQGGRVVDAVQNMGECTAENNAHGYIKSIQVFNSDSNNPVVGITLKATNMEDITRIKLTCNLRTYSAKGNTVFTIPEQDTFEAEIAFRSVMTAGDLVEAEADAVRADMEAFQQKWSGIQSTISFFKGMCIMSRDLGYVRNTLGSLAQATSWLDGTPAAGTPRALAAESNVVGVSNDALREVSQPFCQFLTCDYDIPVLGNYMDSVDNFINDLPGLETMTKIAGYPSGDYTEFVNPDNSIIMSFYKLCIPSMLYNMQKKKAVDCSYLECLTKDVPMGFPKSECDKNKGYMECRYYSGEIFNVIPYTALAKAVSNNLVQVFSDPISLVGGALSVLCWEKSPWVLPHALCNILGATKTIEQMGSIVSKFKNVGGYFQNQYQQPVSYCENILANIDEGTGVWKYPSEQEYAPYMNILENEKVTGLCTPLYCQKGDYVYKAGYNNKGYLYQNGKLVKEEDLQGDIQLDQMRTNLQTSRDKYEELHEDFLVKIDGWSEYSEYLKEVEYQRLELEEAKKEYENLKTKKYEDYISKTTYSTWESSIEKFEQKIEGIKANAEGRDLTNKEKDDIAELKAQIEAEKREMKKLEEQALDKVENDEDVKKKKKELEKTEDSFEDAQDGLEDAEAQIKKDALYYSVWDNGWGTYSTMLSVSRSWGQASAWLWPESGALNTWRRGADQFFNQNALGRALNLEVREQSLCHRVFDREPTTITVETGKITMRPGLHLQAEKSIIINPEGRKQKYYLVTGAVSPKQGTSPQYEVVLRGSQGLYRFKDPTTERDIFVGAKSFSKFPLTLTTSTEYTEVCIKFHGIMSDYFDSTKGVSNNEYCQSIQTYT